jgi:DNA-directed RNA polymerase subunit RPC12/RpoP
MNFRGHAAVRSGDYVIPLIGIPASATAYRCDKCRKHFDVEELEMDRKGNRFLCAECRKPKRKAK